jgi:predicted dehydrogenase
MPAEQTLRVAICGGGMRSRRVWQRHVANEPGLELVGVMDPSAEALDASREEGRVPAEALFTELEQMLASTGPDVLLACPIIEAHGSAVRAGLEAGCHVLVEKPFVTDVGEATELTELAEARGLTLGVVQNWRTRSNSQALKRALEGDRIGPVSHIFFRYVRDREKTHLPDYLFDEADPILWAMGIHHLDLFRYLLGQDIVRVHGQAARPEWSRYRVPSINQLWMETESGVVISYVATFSSRNAHVPQESLQIEGEKGTLYNDSDYFEPPVWLSLRDSDAPEDLTASVSDADREYQAQYDLADLAILRDFRAAVTTGTPLIASARDNLGTLAVLDAARSALAGEPVG